MKAVHRFKHVFTAFLASYLIMLALPVLGLTYLYQRVVTIAQKNSAAAVAYRLEAVCTELNAKLTWMDNSAVRLVLDGDTALMLNEVRLNTEIPV